MTPDLTRITSPLILRDLQSLTRSSKRALNAWLRNRLTVITVSADLTANDEAVHPSARARARSQMRVVDELLGEFSEAFGVEEER